jgi:protein kinase-like protein
MTELNTTIDSTSTTETANPTDSAKTADTTKTLAQRLTEGRIPVEEGLRYAMLLAEALRKMHDEGLAHGAVAPGNIALTETGLELQAPRLTPTATSYAAPEILEGHPADARSDIFSFGAVLYEVLTGHAPYQGKDRSTPMPSGSPAVDRLVANCVALDPAARCQRLQKVMLELKLLSAAAARAGVPAAARRDAVAGDAIRAEVAQMDARLSARLQAEERKSAELLRVVGEMFTRVPEESADMHATVLQMEARVGVRLQDLDKKVMDSQRIANEALYRELPQPGVDAAEVHAIETRVGARMQQAIGEMQTIAADAVNALRGQLTNIGSQLAAAQERSERAEKTIEAAGERLVARVQESIDGVSERITALDVRIATLEQPRPDADAPRVEALEASLEALRKQNAELHDLVAEDMRGFDQNLKTQAAAIESARTAMAQTDDLVERVVEALESLQSTVLDRSEERAVAVN